MATTLPRFISILVITTLTTVPTVRGWTITQGVSQNLACGADTALVPSQCPTCITAPQGPIKFVLPILNTDKGSTLFWQQVITGATNAGKALDIAVEIQGLDGNDLLCDSIKPYAELIRNATATNPQGLVVIPYAPKGCATDILPAISEAVAAGVPVIAINSNPDVALANGALMYVGQDETIAGAEACTRLSTAIGKPNATILVLGLDDGTNPGIIARTAGCESVAKVVYVDTNVSPEADTQAAVEALQNNTDITAILGLGAPNHVVAMIGAAEKAGRAPGQDIWLATFDWGPINATEALSEGVLEFVVDQQAPLQGSIPVQMLYTKAAVGLFPTTNKLLTGPRIVYKNETFAGTGQLSACSSFALPYCGSCSGGGGGGIGNGTTSSADSLRATVAVVLAMMVAVVA